MSGKAGRTAEGKLVLMGAECFELKHGQKTFTLLNDPVEGYASSINAQHPNNMVSGRVVSFGTILIRGSKVVLCRSLATPPAWKGLRMAHTRPKLGETGLQTAVRATCAQVGAINGRKKTCLGVGCAMHA
jgi:hypothetical protein